MNDMEFKLSRNFFGTFFLIIWCFVFYPTLFFLPMIIVFSFIGMIAGMFSTNTSAYNESIMIFPIILFMFLFALWVFKRFPIFIKIDKEYLTIRYAIPWFKLKYKLEEIKFNYKISSLVFSYKDAKCLYIKTKIDPIPIAITSIAYDGDWGKIQDFVNNSINKLK